MDLVLGLPQVIYIREITPNLIGELLKNKDLAAAVLYFQSPILGVNNSSEFSEELIDQVYELIPRLETTTVCLHGPIHGLALILALGAKGGRLASLDPSTSFCLPYGPLGILPYGESLFHLLTLVGLEATCHMVLSGEVTSAEKALKLGLVQTLVPTAYLLDEAIAQKKQTKIATKNRLSFSLDHNPITRRMAYKSYREHLRQRGEQGSLVHILDHVFHVAYEGKSDANIEKKIFWQIYHSQETTHRLHFWSLWKQISYGTRAKKPLTIGFLGITPQIEFFAFCSIMNAGHRVYLFDPRPEVLSLGVQNIRQKLWKEKERRRLSLLDFELKLTLMSQDVQLWGFHQCDVIIDGLSPVEIQTLCLSELKERHKGLWLLSSSLESVELFGSGYGDGYVYGELCEKKEPGSLTEEEKGKWGEFFLSLAPEKSVWIGTSYSLFVPHLQQSWIAFGLGLILKGFCVEVQEQALKDFGWSMSPYQLWKEKDFDFIGSLPIEIDADLLKKEGLAYLTALGLKKKKKGKTAKEAGKLYGEFVHEYLDQVEKQGVIKDQKKEGWIGAVCGIGFPKY